MASVIQQRPLRGSRISTFYPVKNLPSLASLDSAFQLQEYISLLIRLDVHDVDTIVSVPGKCNGKDNAGEGGNSEGDAEQERKNGDVAVDEACWIYEQLRRLAQDLSHPLITMLQQECNRASCPEMKAGEWLYLCVAHGEDGAREQCCAIDYILHTLDSATALLNSPRAFPSRLSIPQTSHRHFSSLARRLGRIFAHAYFHHREAFEQAEAESSLYARFLALTSKFDLVPVEFLVIPPRISSYDGRGEIRRDLEVQPPRLHAAAIDPQGNRHKDNQPAEETLEQEWEHIPQRSKGRSPPGLGPEPGRDSPRRFGRNRTDTMVFSEAAGVAEELAMTDGEHEEQMVNVGSSSSTQTDDQEQDTEECDLLNAPEIPSILDEEGQFPEPTPSESQQAAVEESDGPSAVVSPPSTEPPPTTEAITNTDTETPQPPETTPIAPPSDAEKQEAPQVDVHHAKEEEKPSTTVDISTDSDGTEQQVGTVEAIEEEGFVPVDLTQEDGTTAAEAEQQEETTDALPPSTQDVEPDSPPDAETSVEESKPSEPTPETEKQEADRVEPESAEPSDGHGENEGNVAVENVEPEHPAEDAKAETD